VVYAPFPGRPAFLIKRSVDVLTSHHSHTHIIRTTRLKFFGHTACADPSMNHSRALRACVAPLSRDGTADAGRPRHTWLRTVESDLAPFNIGLATAYHGAQNRQDWSTLVLTATSITGQATRWWRWWWWWWRLVRSTNVAGKPIELSMLRRSSSVRVCTSSSVLHDVIVATDVWHGWKSNAQFTPPTDVEFRRVRRCKFNRRQSAGILHSVNDKTVIT